MDNPSKQSYRRQPNSTANSRNQTTTHTEKHSQKNSKKRFFVNPNYSLSINTSKANNTRKYSKKDFMSYMESPVYGAKGYRSSKSKDYKIRDLSYEMNASHNKKARPRESSKPRLSSRYQQDDRFLKMYKSKQLKLRNVKLRNKIGGLRQKQ